MFLFLNKMKELNIIAHNFKPNLRIIQNYIITYEEKQIKLFDSKANILDAYEFDYYIKDIIIINENHFISVFKYGFYVIKINNGYFEIKNIIDKGLKKINDILFIKNEHLLVVSFDYKIEIYEVNNLIGEPIQKIYNKSNNLFNFTKNIYINYNYDFISFFEKIIGTQLYQLASNIKLEGEKQLIKINEKILLVLLENKKLYKINRIKMKVEEINIPFENDYKIYFLYNNKENIYLHVRNKNFIFKEGYMIDFYENIDLYNIKYNNNEIKIINKLHLKDLEAINYIANKYIIKENNIKSNCTKNLGLCFFCGNFHYNISSKFSFENIINRLKINIYKQKLLLFEKIEPDIKDKKDKKEMCKKQKYIGFKKKKEKRGRNYFNSKKIHQPNGFKKKYR